MVLKLCRVGVSGTRCARLTSSIKARALKDNCQPRNSNHTKFISTTVCIQSETILFITELSSRLLMVVLLSAEQTFQEVANRWSRNPKRSHACAFREAQQLIV